MRCRRRPTRHTESETEITNAPIKHSKKKLRQVTVELQDIRVKRSPPSVKELDKKKTKSKDKTEDIETVETDVSESTLDNKQSPRRAQRKLRTNSEESIERNNKESFTKKSRERKTSFEGQNKGKTVSKEEKDIMTRSKRLKTTPSPSITSMKSPRVMVCRKEVEGSPTRNARDKSLSKTPPRMRLNPELTPSPQGLKRSRSSSSDTSPVKISAELDTAYSSKLRKKSFDGAGSEELAKKDSGTLRSRRKSIRNEDDPGPSKITIRCEPEHEKKEDILRGRRKSGKVEEAEVMSKKTEGEEKKSSSGVRLSRKKSEQEEEHRKLEGIELAKKNAISKMLEKKKQLASSKTEFSGIKQESSPSSKKPPEEKIKNPSGKLSFEKNKATKESSPFKSPINEASKSFVEDEATRKSPVQKTGSEKVVCKRKDASHDDKMPKGLKKKNSSHSKKEKTEDSSLKSPKEPSRLQKKTISPLPSPSGKKSPCDKPVTKIECHSPPTKQSTEPKESPEKQGSSSKSTHDPTSATKKSLGEDQRKSSFESVKPEAKDSENGKESKGERKSEKEGEPSGSKLSKDEIFKRDQLSKKFKFLSKHPKGEPSVSRERKGGTEKQKKSEKEMLSSASADSLKLSRKDQPKYEKAKPEPELPHGTEKSKSDCGAPPEEPKNKQETLSPKSESKFEASESKKAKSAEKPELSKPEEPEKEC